MGLTDNKKPQIAIVGDVSDQVRDAIEKLDEVEIIEALDDVVVSPAMVVKNMHEPPPEIKLTGNDRGPDRQRSKKAPRKW